MVVLANIAHLYGCGASELVLDGQVPFLLDCGPDVDVECVDVHTLKTGGIKHNRQGQSASSGKSHETLVQGAGRQRRGRSESDVVGRLKGRVRSEQVVHAVALIEAGHTVGGANDRVLQESRLPGDPDTGLKIGQPVVLLVQGGAQNLAVGLGADDVSAEQLVIYGVVILGSAGGFQFPGRAQFC